MSDFYNHKIIRKTRKEHRCFGCTQKMPVGSQAAYTSGVWEGDFFASYYCTPCDEYLDKHPELFEEGIYYGDVAEARRQDESA
jgi:hypothetical protein